MLLGKYHVYCIPRPDNSYTRASSLALALVCIRAGDPTRKAMSLITASQEGDTDAVEALLCWEGPHGERLNPGALNDLAACTAAMLGHVAVLRLLLQWVGPRGQFVYPATDSLVTAASAGHTAVVDLLLSWAGPKGQRVDPRHHGNLALRAAVAMGHAAVVRLLLQWRGPQGQWVDARQPDDGRLQEAMVRNHVAVVIELLEWKGPEGQVVDAAADDNALLRWTVHRGHACLLRPLLAWVGHDPASDRVDLSACAQGVLQLACAWGSVDLVQALIHWVGPAPGYRRLRPQALLPESEFPAMVDLVFWDDTRPDLWEQLPNKWVQWYARAEAPVRGTPPSLLCAAAVPGQAPDQDPGLLLRVLLQWFRDCKAHVSETGLMAATFAALEARCTASVQVLLPLVSRTPQGVLFATLLTPSYVAGAMPPP